MMIWYMALEPYNERYTFQLTEWAKRGFSRNGVSYQIVEGETLDNLKSIKTGQVLDAYGRTYYSMTQMAKMVKIINDGYVTDDDVIFFEDMFTPGIESLAYIMCQNKMKTRIFVRCLAQTIDPDDFVHKTGMYDWMSKFEHMVDSMPNVNILASNKEMVNNIRIAGWKSPVFNIAGLTFDKFEVRSRVKKIVAFNQRPKVVAFTSRWDEEKQPDFYMNLAESLKGKMEFRVYSGATIRSNNKNLIYRLQKMQNDGLIKVYDNLDKNEYYRLLAEETRVVFNCAKQDWTSNTVSEADALECNLLYPAYRSFPEIFGNDKFRLYIPWSLNDALDKLCMSVNFKDSRVGEISDWTNATMDRIIGVMKNAN